MMKKSTSHHWLALALISPAWMACEVASGDPIPESLIAFVSDRDGNDDIYVMRSDGTDVTNVTNDDQVTHGDLAWSPDGRHLAFVSDRGGGWDIHVLGANGVLRRLTETDERENSLAWSPDGALIAYGGTSRRRSVIRVLDVESGESRKIGEGCAPSWNVDGRSMLVYRGNIPSIWRLRLDGTVEAQFVRDANETESGYGYLFRIVPFLSPDSESVLFTEVLTSEVAGETQLNYEVCVDDASGGRRRRLTNEHGLDHGCGWSPDGGRILFVSERSGDLEVFVMNRDGSSVKNLTRHPARDHSARWSGVGSGLGAWLRRDRAR